MDVEILWKARDWGRAVAELPIRGPLPCRTVLVPRMRVAHVLRRELIRVGRVDVLPGTRFLLAPAAAAEVLRTAGVMFHPGEDDLRSARLFALFRSELSLRHFSLDLLRTKPGWDEAFAHTISDLEGAGLRPEDLEISGMSEHFRDLAAIWRALDDSARRSWTIQRIYLEAAIVLERNPEIWPFHGAVLACAISNMTHSEARFLRAVPQVTIGLLAGRPIRRRYLERMEGLLGREAAAALRAAEAPRAAGSECDLLASYLFEPPVVLADPTRPRSTGPDGTVDLEEHAGVEAELEATADWVAREVAEGTPLEEIAVLVPDPDPLLGLITDRLHRLPWHDGFLPAYVAEGLPLAGFAAGARALAVVRALRAHLPAELLVDVLPALRLQGESEGHLFREAVMELLWSLGTVGGNPAHAQGALEWSTRAAERQAELEQQLAQARAAEETGDHSPPQRIRDLERLAANLRGIRPALDALVQVARSVVDNAPLSTLWPALRGFFDQWLLQPGEGPKAHIILDEPLGAIAGDRTCGALVGDDALRVVEETIHSTRVPAGRFGEPAVYVGTIGGALGLSFAAVRVVGLAEGHLPSVSREDAVIPDLLRESLGVAGDGRTRFLPTAADHALSDLHALDIVVRNAERRIALSTSRLDVERSQREPSSVILEAAAALARPNCSTGERSGVIPDRAALTRDAFTPARERASQFRFELPLGEAAWHDGVAEGIFGLPQRWRESCSLDLDRISRLATESPGIMDGLLGALAADLPVPGISPEHPLSPSGIGELLNCPHAFLFRRLLGFEEPAVPPSLREIGQPDYGQLFHRVAAEFYLHNGPSFCAHDGKLSDWILAADEIVGRAFEKFLKEYPLVGEAIQRQQRERLRRDIHELVEYDWNTSTGSRFVAAERVFGEPDPVELPAGSGLLYLRGQIDRIDVVGKESLVRDLKTSRAVQRLGKFVNPDPALDIQIAIYGLVAELLADEWGIPKQIAAAYVHFGRSSPAERSFREDFHQLLQPAAQHWLELAARLLADRMFPRTPNPADCSYCCFRPVCGNEAYDRAASLLAGADGVLAEFAALKTKEPEEQES